LERILNDLGRGRELVDLARQARQSLSHRPEIMNMVGRVLFNNDLLMDALHAFEESLAIDTISNLEAHAGLCRIYLACGRYDAALETMRNIRPLFENNLSYWAYWRMLFGSQGETEIPLDMDGSVIDREAAILSSLFKKA
jgi:tetratricopeptide (TPR) repeat protein